LLRTLPLLILDIFLIYLHILWLIFGRLGQIYRRFWHRHGILISFCTSCFASSSTSAATSLSKAVPPLPLFSASCTPTCSYKRPLTATKAGSPHRQSIVSSATFHFQLSTFHIHAHPHLSPPSAAAIAQPKLPPPHPHRLTAQIFYKLTQIHISSSPAPVLFKIRRLQAVPAFSPELPAYHSVNFRISILDSPVFRLLLMRIFSVHICLLKIHQVMGSEPARPLKNPGFYPGQSPVFSLNYLRQFLAKFTIRVSKLTLGHEIFPGTPPWSGCGGIWPSEIRFPVGLFSISFFQFSYSPFSHLPSSLSPVAPAFI